MRGFDFVKIVKMGASLCEQCVTRLHLTSLSFGDRLTSIAYALLFALSKNSFTSLTSLKASHWLLLFGSALSRIFLEQTKKYFYSPKYMMGRSLSRAYFLKNSGMFSTLYLFPCSSAPSKNTPVVLPLPTRISL